MRTSGVHLTKAADGGYSLLGVFSNRWRDRDFFADPEHGGEIVASAAHAEYAKWLDKNPQHAPELWTWHVPGTGRKSRANWWEWTGNFFMASWPLDEDEYKALETWSATEPLGMSFGFFALNYDFKEGSIERYRAFEASVLPLDAAANAWTRIELVAGLGDTEVKEQEMAMSQRKRAALVALYGDDFVKTMEEFDADTAQALDAAGYDSKELELEAEEETVADPAAPVEQPVAVEVATEAAVLTALKALESAVTADLKALASTVEGISARLALLEQGDADERKAAAMPPSLLASYSPRSILERGATKEQNSAVIDGRDKLAKLRPAQPIGAGPINTLLGDIQ